MKKVWRLLLCVAGIVSFFHSCKHQSLGDGGATGGGTTGGGTNGGGTAVTCSPDTAYFQQQVLPIFISNCTEANCHHTRNGNVPPKGVDLTSYDKIMTTGDVRPFRPDNSEVYEKITETDPSKRMPLPPNAPLTTAQIGTIRKWILQGARNNSCVASACDTTNATFSGKIKPIIDNKCLGCHSGAPPQGGINFSTYAGVKSRVDAGRLWGAINHLPGFSPMPKSSPQQKLTDCEITQFRKWIEGGAPNN